MKEKHIISLIAIAMIAVLSCGCTNSSNEATIANVGTGYASHQPIYSVGDIVGQYSTSNGLIITKIGSKDNCDFDNKPCAAYTVRMVELQGDKWVYTYPDTNLYTDISPSYNIDMMYKNKLAHMNPNELSDKVPGTNPYKL